MTDRANKGHLDRLARYLAKKQVAPLKLTGETTPGGTTFDTEQCCLPWPIGSVGDVLTVIDDGGDIVPSWEASCCDALAFALDDLTDVNAPAPSDGDVLTWDSTPGEWVALPPTGGGGSIAVEEGDSVVVATAAVMDFDASDFNVTESPSGEANISLAYGTSAGTPAEGNHSHANDHVAATVLDSSSIDFGITGQQITGAVLYAGSGSAATAAHSDHTHVAGGAVITIQEGDSDVDTAVTTLDFDASDFNVSSSPAGEANISLAYGTSAGTPAEGNHTHSAKDGWSADISDGGSVIAAATYKALYRVPFDCTIVGSYLVADQSGSITQEIKRAAAGTPTTFSTISGSTGVTLSSAQSLADTTLTSWTTSLVEGDVLRWDITGSPASIRLLKSSLAVTRTI